MPPAVDHDERSGRYAILCLIFLAMVAISGGASRADALSQIVVRLASIAAIVAAVMVGGRGRFSTFRGAYCFLAAAAALVLLQLIPLPPSVWLALPGRDFYAEAATAAGIAQPWRPINLTPDGGWNAFLSLLPATAALVVLSYLPPRRSRGIVLPALIAIACVSAVLGLAQLAGGAESPLRFYNITTEGAAVGLFANRNHQALLLALAIPMLLVWALGGAHRAGAAGPRAWIAFSIAILFLMMILLVGSRAGFICAVVGLLAAALLWRGFGRTPGRRSGARRGLAYAVGAAVLGSAVVAALVFQRAMAVDRLLGVDVADDPRVRAAAPLWEMSRTFMPVGSGFGSFDPVFRRFEPDRLLSFSYFNHAHNDLAELAIEAGVAGLVLLAVLLFWWIKSTVILWRTKNQSSETLLFGRLGSVLTGIVMLASLPDYPLRTPLIAVTFVIGCCWMLDASAAGRTDRTATGEGAEPNEAR